MRVLPSFRRIMLPAVVVCVSLVSQSVPAGAQLGALRRAAERRVEQKGEDRMNAAMLVDPTFDNTTLEITAERLDRFVGAVQTMKAERVQNRQRYETMTKESDALQEAAQKAANDNERNNYERTSQRYSDCRDAVEQALTESSERQMQAMTEKMQRDPIGAQNDPKVKVLMAAMQEMATAEQRGDKAASARAQAKLQALMGVVTDSAAIDRSAVAKCGTRPGKPRSMLVSDSLSARAAAMRTAANALLADGDCPKGATLGMTDVQAAMFCERLRSWLGGMRQDAPITRTFTKAEYDLLLARRSDLRKALG